MRIAWREWRVCWDHKAREPVLYSTYIVFAWETGSEISDQLPEQYTESIGFGRLHGIHAVLNWDKSRFLTKTSADGPKLFVQGAVDIHGLVREHEDGVVRAEYARALALRLVEIPYSVPPCEHQDRLWVVNRSLEEGRLIIQHCSCSMQEKLGVGYLGSFMFMDPEPPLIVYESFTREELEDLLLQKYEVVKLPLGVGPWEPPWGVGPVPEMDELGNRSKSS